MKQFDLKKFIIEIKDFPIKGVGFKDITPLLKNAEAFRFAVDKMVDFVKKVKANVIVAPEARGFLFASAVAYASNCGFVVVRKPKKLPREVYEESYDLEYGTNKLQLHKDDLKSDDKVVVIDDVLATGGTIKAIIKLVQHTGAKINGLLFLADLKFLHDKDLFSEYENVSLIEY
ncbi:adenine phosphoribosyltransferase [Spiroplasma corruscae]|uniref:Adenine phosphoribosyltransferase n=1 Tax=Spiroplasma corruscae TaxID=216934 RepID=A0A222ENP6_9MOLU|nr:adenine phosphoribosyltransferase [Spiroplasma corruscae]ASP28125.1 adenine phosphoribosyltransferase [Spiroplasma corruscae]